MRALRKVANFFFGGFRTNVWSKHSYFCCLMLLINLGSFASGEERRTVTIESKVNVLDFGAKGDGKTDDTAAFQKALNEMGKAIGGTVFVPRGNFFFAGHLNIPANVTLQGIWHIPTAWRRFEGTTLLVTEGQGSDEGVPFITLGTNSVLKGVTIYYPNQVNKNPPKSYPWTVASGGGDNMSIINVLMVNPYQAVDFGSKPSGRHYIRNLYGQPLRRGIFIDRTFDVGRIANVHFWPFWVMPPGPLDVGVGGVTEFVATYGEAFIFGRACWQYVHNTFVWGYRVGYRFIRTESGTTNGNFLGIAADATNIALQIDEVSGAGLLITNGQFVSFVGPNPTHIVVGEANEGTIMFQNSSFWGPAYQIASIKGTGTVMFNNCNFRHWKNTGIESSGGKLIVNSSFFGGAREHIRLNPGVKNAVITSNIFTGRKGIVNNSEGDVQIGMNSAGLFANVKEVYGKLGKEPVNRGVTLRPSGGDGLVEPVKIDEKHGHKTIKNKYDNIRYMYFRIDDSFLFHEDGVTVDVVLKYYDYGFAAFEVFYDSADPEASAREGAFKSAGVRVYAEGSKEWLSVEFTLEDGKFANRCNRADFRLAVFDGDLAVSKVIVRKQ